MHLLKALVVFGTTVAVANAIVDCGNNSVSTVYVMTPASTVTETVLVTRRSRHSLTSSIESTLSNVQASSITLTVTSLVTSTNVVTLVQLTLGGDGLHQFSFAEQNGKTVWLGHQTPPSFLRYTVQTSNVRIQPLPTTAVVPQKDQYITSGELMLSYRGVGNLIMCSHRPAESNTTSKKAYTGHGPAGWNATTFTTIVGSSRTFKSTAFAPEKDKVVTNSTSLPSYPTASLSRWLKGRDVGDMVVAKINGVLVSWANLYDGTSPETSSLPISEPSHSAQALPTYSWDALVEGNAPSPAHSPSPSITLAPYPWGDRPQESTILSSVVVPTSVSFLNLTRTATSSAEVAGCTGGGDAGFTISFDDLPHFSISSDSVTTDIPPIFNPYRKLFWQGQFGYVPPPSDPFPPQSPPQLAVYRAHGPEAQGSPDAGLELPGEVGSGPRASDSVYWFDAHSVWFGCSDGSHVHCIVTINGYTNGSSTHTVSYTTALDPCFGLKGCTLTHIEFPDEFRSLSGLQFIATIAGEVVDYYMDDLHLLWSNQTCAAEEERSSAE